MLNPIHHEGPTSYEPPLTNPQDIVTAIRFARDFSFDFAQKSHMVIQMPKVARSEFLQTEIRDRYRLGEISDNLGTLLAPMLDDSQREALAKDGVIKEKRSGEITYYRVSAFADQRLRFMMAVFDHPSQQSIEALMDRLEDFSMDLSCAIGAFQELTWEFLEQSVPKSKWLEIVDSLDFAPPEFTLEKGRVVENIKYVQSPLSPLHNHPNLTAATKLGEAVCYNDGAQLMCAPNLQGGETIDELHSFSTPLAMGTTWDGDLFVGSQQEIATRVNPYNARLSDERTYRLPTFRKNDFPIMLVETLPGFNPGEERFLVVTHGSVTNEHSRQVNAWQTYIFDPNNPPSETQRQPKNLTENAEDPVLAIAATRDRMAVSYVHNPFGIPEKRIALYDTEGHEIPEDRIKDEASKLLFDKWGNLYYLTRNDGKLKRAYLADLEAGLTKIPEEVLKDEEGFVSLVHGPDDSILAVKQNGETVLVYHHQSDTYKRGDEIQRFDLGIDGGNIIEAVTSPDDRTKLAYVCRPNPEEFRYDLHTAQLKPVSQ